MNTANTAIASVKVIYLFFTDRGGRGEEAARTAVDGATHAPAPSSVVTAMHNALVQPCRAVPELDLMPACRPNHPTPPTPKTSPPTPPPHPHTAMHDTSQRWRVVRLRHVKKKSIAFIADCQDDPARTIQRILKCYRLHRDVRPPAHYVRRAPPPRAMKPEHVQINAGGLGDEPHPAAQGNGRDHPKRGGHGPTVLPLLHQRWSSRTRRARTARPYGESWGGPPWGSSPPCGGNRPCRARGGTGI